jgi:hypothetical protein
MSIDEPTTTSAAIAAAPDSDSAVAAPDSAPLLLRPRSHPHLHHRLRGGVFVSPAAAPAPETADS